MTDDRMDLLIRRLDVGADPDRQFVETSLADSSRPSEMRDGSTQARSDAWGRRCDGVVLRTCHAVARCGSWSWWRWRPRCSWRPWASSSSVPASCASARSLRRSPTWDRSSRSTSDRPPSNGVEIGGGRVLFLGETSPTRTVRAGIPAASSRPWGRCSSRAGIRRSYRFEAVESW